jgi:hypothetical protein
MIARLITTVFVMLLATHVAVGAPYEEEGLTGLHAKVRIGGKLCLADHTHQGQSSGALTRKAAEAAAIRSWSEFTSWEYSRAWGNFQLAMDKSMTCSQNGTTWGCVVEAQPCRR